MPERSFTRDERLKSRKLISALFQQGSSFGVYPLRLVWMEIEPPLTEAPVQFTVAVPKKKFSKAVDRNRLKRQVREAWRTSKYFLYERLEKQAAGKQFAFLVMYTAKEPFSYPEIEKATRKMIRRFLKEMEQKQKEEK